MCACLLILVGSSLFAQRGKDGSKTVSSQNLIVNEYTTLSADVFAGSTSLSVSNSSLNANSVFPAPLSAGDLIMIIQIQGATIKVAMDSTYGEILNYNNCGNYEFCEVAGVPGQTTINLNCPLQHHYSSSGKVQVIRVPRYASLTVNNASSVTGSTWNGSVGGVVAIEVSGNTLLNGSGKIDVSGKGFRGGILNENLSSYGVNNTYWPTGDLGAEKGEGVAGFETVYDQLGGRYCRGAAANGGGGADAHNSGGGGGANAGDINAYNGKGCPDVSNTSWIAAWNLEFNGFAALASSGGGRGGYTFSATNQNALVTPPNNTAWGGDKRDYNGGLGGRPLDYSTGKIFIGGGGGAGDQNDNKGGGGGNGGGIIYLTGYGTVSGTGQFIANGGDGINTSANNGTDGAGGGGGGGTIILNSIGSLTGISAAANGGNGGNQTINAFNQEAEGPGAGGGGGYIAISNGTISKTVNGGNNGTTNSFSLTEFPPNGATKGGVGINNAVIGNYDIITSDTTICSGNYVTLHASAIGVIPVGSVIAWYDNETGGNLLGTGNNFTTPALASTTNFYAGICPGTFRQKIVVNVDQVQPVFSFSPECLGTAIMFSATATSSLGVVSSWQWNFGDGSGTASSQNTSYVYGAASTYNASVTVRDNLGCSSTFTQPVLVFENPSVSFFSDTVSGCGNLTTAFANNTTNGSIYTWIFGDGSTSTAIAPTHQYNSPGNYTVSLTATSVNGCTVTDSIVHLIHVNPLPTAAFQASPVCYGDTVRFIDLSTGNGQPVSSHHWDFGDGAGTSALASPNYFYSSAGNFQVQLMVTNNAGCVDSISLGLAINPAPAINFSPDSTVGCGELSVTFMNNSSGASFYNWDFGDGTGSILTNPTHVYSSPGTYSVVLSGTTGSCSAVDTMANLVVVNPKPMAAFNASSVCLNDTVHFLNASNSNGAMIVSYSWDFGDTGVHSSLVNPDHFYLTAGNYPVKLMVTNQLGCMDSITHPITIYDIPSVNFSASGSSACDSLTVFFTNSSSGAISYMWSFGDGSASASAQPNHLYTTPGNYTVMLDAVSSNGCVQSMAIVNAVTIYNTPFANFSASQSSICPHQCILFQDSSGGNVTSWLWSFPGATPSSSVNQVPGNICYSMPGSYTVSLSVSNGHCTSLRTDSNVIHVNGCLQPVADFICSDTTVCSGSCLTFVSLSQNMTALHWLFPGATPSFSNAINPTNICYAGSGNYDVTLIASNPGQFDTLFLPGFIHVNVAPSAPVIYQAGDTLFVPAYYGYQWNYNGVLLSGETNQFYVAAIPGTYSVTVYDANGCSSASQPYIVSTVGILSVNENDFVHLFPNPASDMLYVELETNPNKKIGIELRNILGEKLAETIEKSPGKTQLFSFNIKSFPAGVYMISIETDMKTVTKKFVKIN